MYLSTSIMHFYKLKLQSYFLCLKTKQSPPQSSQSPNGGAEAQVSSVLAKNPKLMDTGTNKCTLENKYPTFLPSLKLAHLDPFE